ncbi:hypothetical protein AAC387_Pa01g0519 [Persea americana]
MAKKIGRNEASSSRSRGESVVLDHGRRRSSCGYCKSKAPTSITHGLSASSLTVDDYQDLLDRGWRRSGSFLYKPEMEKTCCPSYTIRLKAEDFVPSKEQARVYKRMQRYLDGQFDAKKSDHVKDKLNSSNVLGSLVRNKSSNEKGEKSVVQESSAKNSKDQSKLEECIHYLSNKIDSSVRACITRGEFPPSVQLPKATVKKVTPQAKKKLTEISGDLLYTSSISFQIAAIFRRSQSEENDLSPAEVSRNGQFFELTPKGIAEKLACLLDQQGELSGLSIKAYNGHLNFYLSTTETASGEAPVTVNSSGEAPVTGANAKRGGILNNHAVPPHKRRRLEIHLKRSSFDPVEFALYRKYQMRVHNDKPNEVLENSYRRFLVDTPLIYVPSSGDSTVPPCGYGSFHQQYVIDGKLVAVGVVDILPRCLSSKYLFWDPDLAFLSLGKYSALQEIDWVKENQVHCPSLQYYYLGYYIHSCSKMRYKASYNPSELLCPLRFQWVPFDIARPLLDKKPYVVLSDFPTLQNGVSTPSQITEKAFEQHCTESSQNKQHEALSDSDEEMEPDFEGSDAGFDENSSPEENSHVASADELTAGDVGNIKIDLNETHVKFKDLQQSVHPSQKQLIDSLEQQLQKYARAVGSELADRMVYTL